MADENYDELIEQKLTEFYNSLNKEFNSLKERTSVVRQIVDALSKAGRDRIEAIENAIDHLCDEINKSVAIIRNTFSSSTADTRSSLEVCVQTTQTSLQKSVEKVCDAIEFAGKVRVEGMTATVNTFSRALDGLVQKADESTMKMKAIVAELKGLPLVVELRECKAVYMRQTEELKGFLISVNGKVTKTEDEIEGIISRLKSVHESVEEVKTTFINEQRNMANETWKGLRDVGVEIADKIRGACEDIRVLALESRKEFREHLVEYERRVQEAANTAADDRVKLVRLLKTLGFTIVGLLIVLGVVISPIAIKAWLEYVK